MLSRRNIRIKVFQQHYAKRLDATLKSAQLEQRFRTGIQQSYDLLMFNVWQLAKVCELSKQEAERRHSKYLPSEEDLAFRPKLFDNNPVRAIMDNETFRRKVKDRKVDLRVSKDMGQLFYNEFAKSEAYAKYLAKDTTDDDDKAILLALYRYCTSDESFNEYMEEKYDNWLHDKSLVVGAVKKILRGLPEEDEFLSDFIPSDDATLEFGEDLLYKSLHFDDELLDIIQPALKNWNVDRVAIIDLILLKLAVCEMLYFPTIPVKVSINEYVDLSKIYSTPKSKDFINGILDRLMKQLMAENKIIKQGRGLLDE